MTKHANDTCKTFKSFIKWANIYITLILVSYFFGHAVIFNAAKQTGAGTVSEALGVGRTEPDWENMDKTDVIEQKYDKQQRE